MHHIDQRLLKRNAAHAEYRAMLDNGFSEQLATAILCDKPAREWFSTHCMLVTPYGRSHYAKRQAAERRKDREDPSRVVARSRERLKRLTRPGSPFRRGAV